MCSGPGLGSGGVTVIVGSSGGAITRHSCRAGSGSTLPKMSIARTWKTCRPGSICSIRYGDSQLSNGSASSEHSYSSTGPTAENSKIGLMFVDGFVGARVDRRVGRRRRRLVRPRPHGRRRVDVQRQVDRAHQERVVAGLELDVLGRVEALLPDGLAVGLELDRALEVDDLLVGRELEGRPVVDRVRGRAGHDRRLRRDRVGADLEGAAHRRVLHVPGEVDRADAEHVLARVQVAVLHRRVALLERLRVELALELEDLLVGGEAGDHLEHALDRNDAQVRDRRHRRGRVADDRPAPLRRRGVGEERDVDRADAEDVRALGQAGEDALARAAGEQTLRRARTGTSPAGRCSRRRRSRWTRPSPDRPWSSGRTGRRRSTSRAPCCPRPSTPRSWARPRCRTPRPRRRAPRSRAARAGRRCTSSARRRARTRRRPGSTRSGGCGRPPRRRTPPTCCRS